MSNRGLGKPSGPIFWALTGIGALLAVTAGAIALSARHRNPSEVEVNLLFVAGLAAVVAFLLAQRFRDGR
jgi:hypothetical protein